MRLVTFRDGAGPRPGVLDGDDGIVDLAGTFASVSELVRAGPAGTAEAASQLAGPGHRVRIEDVVLAPPLLPPRNVFCVGRNYQDHVVEIGAAPPSVPSWFSKPVSALCGPYDDVVVDLALDERHDWEVELAVVIGRGGRGITRDAALSHIHSYTVMNDFSLRTLQAQSQQVFKAKSLDASSALGPWLVTADEVGDPQDLLVRTSVNGVVRQQDSTRGMIFDVAAFIVDLSAVLALEPGDVISTGTPSGVGMSLDPPTFLAPGDVLEMEIAGIGRICNRMVGRSG